MVVAGAVLAGFAGLGALTGIVFRAVFTKRRYGLERIVSLRLLTLAVFVVWASVPFALIVVDTGELISTDERFVILTFALPVALIGCVGSYRHRISPRVLSQAPGRPLIVSTDADPLTRQRDEPRLPARPLPTPF